MTLAMPTVGSMPSLDTVKMEDRKRPAVDDATRNAPPTKKQAVVVNGATSHPDADMPWKEDLEDFTKDAIQRRMREYKREAQATRDQLKETAKRSVYHDDHLRLVDSWFSQLVDEIALLCGEVAPSEKPDGYKPFESSLLGASVEAFDEHLHAKSSQIKSAISAIFSKLPGSEAVVTDLQERMAKLLAEQKRHTSELAKTNAEKEQLSERLENASIRYMMAEKKMDRVRSQAVQKAEAQAKAPAKSEADVESPTAHEETKTANGVSDEELQGVESAKRQALAAKEKIAEQLARMEEENQRLTEKMTSAQVKSATLSDEDYANTELYKTLRAQHEDVIKRVNDLQATHVQLRNEIKQLHAERMSYKDEVDKEAREATMDSERQAMQLESDIARIRKARDEAIVDATLRKSKEESDKESVKQDAMRQAAQEARISALESELQRHQPVDENAVEIAEDGVDLEPEELRAKLRAVEHEKKMLTNELSSMGVAYQKAHMAANKKYLVLVDFEDRIGKANAEKAKADQKFFAAMKAKEVQMGELRTLKAQNAKSSDIVAQLKEAEGQCRSLMSQLDKQLAESRDSLAALTQTHRDLQQKSYEQKKRTEQLTSQNLEIEKLLKQKDVDNQNSLQARHRAEQEAKELQVQLEEAQKSLESWRKKGSSNQGAEFEMLKGIATCSVCRKGFKNTALKTCGHVFCDQCVQDRISNRARKCPNCGKAFGIGDTMRVVL